MTGIALTGQADLTSMMTPSKVLVSQEDKERKKQYRNNLLLLVTNPSLIVDIYCMPFSFFITCATCAEFFQHIVMENIVMI